MAKKKESKQKKMNVRVDFTPMVDMMMLLITFFMLCTSLAKPQAMQLTMPAKNNDKIDKEDKDRVETKELVNVYVCPGNKLYTYIVPKEEFFGKEEYLEEVTYGKGDGTVKSIREVLTKYNPYDEAVPPVQAILNAKKQLVEWQQKQPHSQKESTDTLYTKALTMIAKGYLDVVDNNGLKMDRFHQIQKMMLEKTENPDDLKTTLKVNIKPLDDCTYENVVAILDEMSICCIGSYRISDINDQDRLVLSKVGLAEAPVLPAGDASAQ
jgi:hypothetical protein